MRYTLPFIFLIALAPWPAHAAPPRSSPARSLTPNQATFVPASALAISAPTATAPAWIHWLGWSRDGQRFGVRQGPYGTGNRPGRPIWLVRLDAHRHVAERHRQVDKIKEALLRRRIARRGWLYAEQLQPTDVLVRTTSGQLFAIALRGTPPVVAVLRRTRGRYRVVAQQVVRQPAARVRVGAYESSDGARLAVIAHTGKKTTAQASLFVVAIPPLDQTDDARPQGSGRGAAVEKRHNGRAVHGQEPAGDSGRGSGGSGRARRPSQHPHEAHTAASRQLDRSAPVSY